MKQSKAAKIRELKAANPEMTVAEIAKKLGCTTQYVHSVFYLDKKKPSAPKKRGRPAKKASILDVVPTQQEETPILIRDSFRVKLLERENDELRAVIRYLEGKVYGAPV